MKQSAMTALAVAGLLALPTAARATAPDKANIAETIRADVARMIAGINAHDAVQATTFDAPDIISMEAGRSSTVGVDADRAGMAMVFKYVPTWRLTVIDATVDVADSGEMAVYRCTANQAFTGDDGTPMIEKMNYIAAFRRDARGAWKVAWSMVAPMEKPHKR